MRHLPSQCTAAANLLLQLRAAAGRPPHQPAFSAGCSCSGCCVVIWRTQRARRSHICCPANRRCRCWAQHSVCNIPATLQLTHAHTQQPLLSWEHLWPACCAVAGLLDAVLLVGGERLQRTMRAGDVMAVPPGEAPPPPCWLPAAAPALCLRMPHWCQAAEGTQAALPQARHPWRPGTEHAWAGCLTAAPHGGALPLPCRRPAGLHQHALQGGRGVGAADQPRPGAHLPGGAGAQHAAAGADL